MTPTCECGRPARFSSPSWGRHVSRVDHALCQRCWKAQGNRERAAHLSQPRRDQKPARRRPGLPDPVGFDTPRLRALRAALAVLDRLYPHLADGPAEAA